METTSYAVRRVPIYAQNIVATSQPLAAQAGVRALLAGGNAVDAALSAAIALTVVEPTGNGIGSDAFAIVWDGKKLHGLNASGRSPATWTPDRFSGQGSMPQRGWESVTVPGAVSAWVDLSKRFGRLPFKALFEPAIDYARKGFPVSPTIAALWRNGARLLASQPGFAEHFMPGERTPGAGEIFRNPNLARTLELIAQSDGKEFYHGELADRIAKFAAEHGAALSKEDLSSHQNDWCGTISKHFNGVDVHEIPPNGQGIAALMALGILSETEIGDHHPDSAEAYHLQIEAMKLAFADVGAFVSDIDTMVVPPAALLDQDYLKKRASLIDRSRAKAQPVGAPKQGGTVYLTAADDSGMMVSFIQSNYAGFGSGVVVPGTGIHLQNRGSGFSLTAGHPNIVAPRKRPFHTIIPAFAMKDGAPLMSFGVMGGPMQAQGHVQMVLRTQLYGQDPQSASNAPRWRYTEGLGVALETAVPADTQVRLAEMGHQLSLEPPDNAYGFGGAQIIQRIDGAYVAGSDHRKDGAAIGF